MTDKTQSVNMPDPRNPKTDWTLWREKSASVYLFEKKTFTRTNKRQSTGNKIWQTQASPTAAGETI